MDFSSCLARQEEVKKLFNTCSDTESKFGKIMELGRELGQVPAESRVEEARVHGCQSRMYLCSRVESGKILFEAESDALISSGLAVLLLRVYSGEPLEALFHCPPSYLEELGIPGSLTPGRAIGLASLYKTMQQHAARALA